MAFSAKEMIKKRKSCRSFDGAPLRVMDRAALEKYIEDVSNPFDVPVEFRLLDAKEYGLMSPVVAGADVYMAAKVSRCPNFEIGFGYSFEKACLYAEHLGMGTVILAASLNRAAFEKAMDVKEGEVMPVASPVGYPAEKRTNRDALMRKGIKSDERLDPEKLFFVESFDHSLSKEYNGVFAEALEMLRWAPSATNRQPWRVIVSGGKVHFYEEKTLKDSPLGDIQKVDMGIALCHFDLTMQENGHTGAFVFEDPGLAVPENVHYIVTYERVE